MSQLLSVNSEQGWTKNQYMECKVYFRNVEANKLILNQLPKTTVIVKCNMLKVRKKRAEMTVSQSSHPQLNHII